MRRVLEVRGKLCVVAYKVGHDRLIPLRYLVDDGCHLPLGGDVAVTMFPAGNAFPSPGGKLLPHVSHAHATEL